MKYASEDLRNEHEGVLFALDILEKMTDTIRQEGTIDAKDAVEIVNFFRLFADKCHHGKEEGLMFPAMEKVGIPNKGALLVKCFLNTIKAGSILPKWWPPRKVVRCMRVGSRRPRKVTFS